MVTLTRVEDHIDYCKAKFVLTDKMTQLDWAALFDWLGLQYSSIEILDGVLIGPMTIFKSLKQVEGMLLVPPKLETDEDYINRRFGEEF
ncbi:MAG: hypothetical protein KA413_00410 [Candidatus Methylopumilus sp.]|nr:hypothetical protein [Candidatus Methylopumilus sp.]